MYPLKKSIQLLSLLIFGLLTAVCSTFSGRYEARSTELAAIVFATQTAQVTPVPSLTPSQPPTLAPTVTSSPIPSSTPVSSSNWPVFFSDSFDASQNDWPMGEEANDYVHNQWSIVGGKYRWEVEAIQDVHWYVYPDIENFEDFYLSAEMEKVSGPEDCSFGVVFRVKDDNNFYVFLISETGYYSIYRVFGGSWYTLVDWTYSSAIRAGEVNQLRVEAQDAHFEFWINDRHVYALDDTWIKTGRPGLTMILYQAGEQATFEFDNFEVRGPQQ